MIQISILCEKYLSSDSFVEKEGIRKKIKSNISRLSSDEVTAMKKTVRLFPEVKGLIFVLETDSLELKKPLGEIYKINSDGLLMDKGQEVKLK